MTLQPNTTNTSTATREPGFYWVNDGDFWLIAEWHNGKWFRTHLTGSCSDDYWAEIDERPLTREQASSQKDQEPKREISDCVRQMYDELLIENRNNRWINPVLTDLDTPFSENHFSVEIDDFIEIQSTSNILIYRVLEQRKKYTIFCKPLNDND